MTSVIKVDTIQSSGGTTGLTIDSSVGVLTTPADPLSLSIERPVIPQPRLH